MKSSIATKNETIARLRRAEGQLRGIQKMIDEDKDMENIAQQYAAVRSAIDGAFLSTISGYLSQEFKITSKTKSKYDAYLKSLIRYT